MTCCCVLSLSLFLVLGCPGLLALARSECVAGRLPPVSWYWRVSRSSVAALAAGVSPPHLEWPQLVLNLEIEGENGGLGGRVSYGLISYFCLDRSWLKGHSWIRNVRYHIFFFFRIEGNNFLTNCTRWTQLESSRSAGRVNQKYNVLMVSRKLFISWRLHPTIPHLFFMFPRSIFFLFFCQTSKNISHSCFRSNRKVLYPPPPLFPLTHAHTIWEFASSVVMSAIPGGQETPVRVHW